MTAGDGLSHAYTVTVTNGGPSDAAAVTLTVGWPAGFSQGAVSASQGTAARSARGPTHVCPGPAGGRRERHRHHPLQRAGGHPGGPRPRPRGRQHDRRSRRGQQPPRHDDGGHRGGPHGHRTDGQASVTAGTGGYA